MSLLATSGIPSVGCAFANKRYRGTSLIRNGSDKKQAFFGRFFFLIALEISKRFWKVSYFSRK